ncbi:unnamed protein product [Linum trigynum]|uniref:RNase H type-1 domain-containing protein n=1 Tax=Linum trigynum TaxID=586398 RepID=A0AAV2DGW9_9ROSI
MPLWAQGIHVANIDDPMTVELLVLWAAILWCLESGFADARFEGDAKVIIDKINQANTRDSTMGAYWRKLYDV